MNVLKLKSEEYSLFSKLIKDKEENISITHLEEDLYEISMDDDMAEELSEIIKESYTYEGFDKNYKRTAKGKLYEDLIDKFYDIGW